MSNFIRNISKLKDKFTKTEFERTLHQCTSNDLTFPPQEDLELIARRTFNGHEYQMIVDHITKKLLAEKEENKKWRKIVKALQLLEVCLKKGHKRVKLDFIKQLHIFYNLNNYENVENGIDRGKTIRDLSKKVVRQITETNEGDYDLRQSTQSVSQKSGKSDKRRAYEISME